VGKSLLFNLLAITVKAEKELFPEAREERQI
jgi:hypothetical protein